ncbi:beta-1,3-galactosyltransferase brn-like [Pecten maximus]|uniref:beta-1,3-galactosyltransferase brn-like n=1 Tax=Pecten maximus TaxID=6579 RepID=UPI001458108B|nr:beta-1,3-galactosyltransferase brn-like [Pecten maximus]XP_033759945.1 beta-1,3-galactosyltransferase brn-like [Pecten maximus]XP_033759946.1 beta-1,3-galactosyltransferase brn-like [Pecten maximus]XP_033759947.1 beta-1,3-galactosyltransferase brn-like [Pecten maximus]XP_033759948.1 beta-1,3-galactosyltransferase brn-like [Pecten maximus]
MKCYRISRVKNSVLVFCVTCLLFISIHDFLQQHTGPDRYDDITTFPKYNFGFFFPLEIDLRKIVEDKIVNDTEPDYSPINKHPFRYIHRPSTCSFNTKQSLGFDMSPNLLVLVKSAVKNDRLRMTIRMSWGRTKRRNVKIVFLVADSPQTSQFISLESQTYQDIVQEDFIDNYSNNTLKTIMGYSWAVKYCSKADFFLFVDDDHFVNIPKVLLYIKSIPENERKTVFYGKKVVSAVPSRADSKWAISKIHFPFHLFPSYLGGGAYLTSYSCALRFYHAFPYVDFFWIDDVYLGIVAHKLNITAKHVKQFITNEENPSLDRGFFSHFNNHNAEDMIKAWQRAQDKYV